MATDQPSPASATAIARPIPRLAPVTNAARSLISHHLAQRFEEKVIAPHHAFVHAQSLALMVHAMLEKALPARRLMGEEFRRGERGQNAESVIVITPCPRDIRRQPDQVQ